MLTTAIMDETIVRFSERGKLLGRPSYWSLRRWAKQGIASRATEELVTLEYCYIGRSPATSKEAYERFNKRMNGELPV